MLPSASFAGCSSYCWAALGPPLCSARMPCVPMQSQGYKAISRLLQAYISSLDLSPEFQTHVFNCILDLPMWCQTDTSNLPCPKGNLQSFPKPALPIAIQPPWTKDDKFLPSQSQVSKPWSQSCLFSFPHLLHAVCQEVLFTVFKMHSESDFSPPPLLPPGFKTPSFLT